VESGNEANLVVLRKEEFKENFLHLRHQFCWSFVNLFERSPPQLLEGLNGKGKYSFLFDATLIRKITFQHLVVCVSAARSTS
jgi:hypothetical protein